MVWDFASDVVLYQAARRALVDPEMAQGHTVRCWSCGCSTGEEALSLAVLWHHRLAEAFPSVQFEVLGTDVEAQNIEAARRHLFPPHALAEYPERWIEQDFEALAVDADYSTSC